MPADTRAAESAAPMPQPAAAGLPGADAGPEARQPATAAATAVQMAEAEPQPADNPAPPVPDLVDVHDLDWEGICASLAPAALRARMRGIVERLEALLDSEGGAPMLFHEQRNSAADYAPMVTNLSDEPLWFIGDLHGDLLALHTALALIRREAAPGCGCAPRIVLLGDLFDDGGYGLETLLRVFELIVEHPRAICVLAGNHDEALGYTGSRFTASVSPSDFCDFLNDHLSHEWIGRVGKLAIRLAAAAPRALFFPDGLLVAHGGFPLADLHQHLADTMDWNDPRCLNDFVWSRAHPRARKKLPNRTSRGSQFGHEDFAAFCALSATLGRPVTHMVRGHDHVDERYELYPAYARTPVLTTVALSRRLPRELFGPYVRVPTIARWSRGTVPQVYRLHIPERLIRGCYPEDVETSTPAGLAEQEPT